MDYFYMVEGNVLHHQWIDFAETAESAFFVTGTRHESGPSCEDAVGAEYSAKGREAAFHNDNRLKAFSFPDSKVLIYGMPKISLSVPPRSITKVFLIR